MSSYKFIIPLLRKVVAGNATNFEINSLIRLTHQFASIRLTQIIRSKKIVFEILPHSITTIALDCIAEIFHRDSDGNFIELQHYFSEDKDLAKTKDQLAFINYRRLIFSKINDGVFRIYKEYDPITSKIIRNLKLIIKRSDNIFSICRFGETYFTLTPNDLNETEIEMSPGDLESELVLYYPFIEGLDNIFLKLLEILAQSKTHRRFYSLIDLALIIKNIYMCHKKIPFNNLEIDKDQISNDINKVVERSLIEIKCQLEVKYLKSKKMDQIMFDQYMSALNHWIINTYVENNGAEYSHFDYLSMVKSDLTHDEFRNNHRSVFEYFVKVSRSIIVNNLKESFE